MVRQIYDAKNYRTKDSVGYLVRAAQNLMMPRLEAALAAHDASFVQYVVLMHLRDGMGNTCADIARSFNHDPGALTRVVDQLDSRGLVARERQTDDRRVIELTLTPKGAELLETLIIAVTDLLNEALKDFSPEEAKSLIALLTKLVTSLGDKS